ncbi:MAG: ammonia-forming cytochrome c nitrite reductase subunit c552 [Desulfovibrio sp.]|nr:ammonia-forming cytochrome c nitrite reductase subunit c552 [Desulfovibrio sp.]
MNKRLLRAGALCCAFLGVWALAGCNDVSSELTPPTYKTGIAPTELSSKAFAQRFPSQYASYMKNNESEIVTDYKGSIAFHKHNNFDPLPKGFKHTQPYLKNLWLGYPFMYEYNEPRGHTHAVEDFVNIDRLDSFSADGKGHMPATCWNCKTPRLMQWMEKYGDDFWSKDVNEFRGPESVTMDESISCVTCHDPGTMELRPYSEPLKDWLKRSGQDWNKISRNEKRTLVCAQCHVEYYFTAKGRGPLLRPAFPWDLGKSAQAAYEYYKTRGPMDANGKETPFTDWVHAASKVSMLKAQHPDYETFHDGPHGAAGVSCADCHMQYVREDGKKVSSHWMTSPMKDKEMRACRQCHADKTPEYLRSRVLYIQDKVFARLLEAERISVKAHEAVRLANAWEGEKAENYDALMAEAREMVRKGQFFWDYVSAENSIGFHNPAKQLDTLMTSFECSQKAVDLATEATRFGIAQSLAGEIETIVPPITHMSRELQQDEEFLSKHPWTKLLPVMPKHGRTWKGQERIKTKEVSANN